MAKRKREETASGKSSKKVAFDAPPNKTKVSSLLQAKNSPPVIATAPGISMPSKLSFSSYAPPDLPTKKKSKQTPAQKELLLHSIDHPKLDYTAKEETARGSKPLLNHFVGVYDPKTGKMQVVEAKKMVVRGAVRAKQQAEAEAAEKNIQQTMYDRRVDLGQTFGTKKAKKALQDNVLNAIAPTSKFDNPPKIDAASRAMLSSVGAVTSTMASRDDLQAVVDEAKPVPKANMEAEEIEDVYDPYAIIGKDILNLVPIREWQEAKQHDQSIKVASRYVASRLKFMGSTQEDATRMRILRYMYFVLVFNLACRPGKERGTKSVPQRKQLHSYMDPAPEAVVENIRRKFSEAGVMRKFHMDLLITHVCVFASIVDNFDSDTSALREDLKLTQQQMNQYFHEIGVRPTQKKNEAGHTVHVARLKLPLDFPKQRHLGPKKR